MVRVDCDDCSMNFQTKKLYIKHIKSKECSKSKRAATGSPTSSIHAEKRPRLEIIPQSNYSPSQIAALQSQISQLSQKQKEHLQIQLAQSTAKQRQALQNIPFNQLSDKQKNALKRLSPSPSSSSTSKVIITKNSDPKEIITIRPAIQTKSVQNQSKSNRRTYSRSQSIVQEVNVENEEDDLPVISDFEFSDDPIALDDDEIPEPPAKPNNEDEVAPVIYGSIKVRGIGKSFLDISNVLNTSSSSTPAAPVDRPTTPSSAVSSSCVNTAHHSPSTATPKETCLYCRKIFSKSGIDKHVEFKHKIKCDHCDVRHLPEDMKEHVNKEHSIQCPHCDDRFVKVMLTFHIENEHKINCPKCSEKVLKTDLEKHTLEVHLTEVCGECPSRFETKNELEEHEISTHPKENCDECDLVFGRKEELTEHKEKEHAKMIKFNGGMFMMMMADDEVEDEKEDVEHDDDKEERERLEREKKVEEEKRMLSETMRELVCDVADDIVKTAMTGTILFALRFEN